MLVAIVLDRPLADVKTLADDSAAFTQEMTKILSKSKAIHLLRKRSSQQEVVTHLPQNSAASSTEPCTPQRRHARAVPAIANG